MRRSSKIGFSGRAGSSGFSLIELLIVVAVILVIAAIAIPNLLRAKIAANESSAANSVRKIATAQVAYGAAYPTIGYATAISALGGPAAACSPTPATACILDSSLSSGVKSGYQFLAAAFSAGGAINTDFVASSSPQTYNVDGIKDFCVITDGVLRISPGASGVPPAPDVATCQAYPMTQ